MNNSKLTISLDFKGRDELEQIVAEIGKKHDIPVDIDISSAKLGILKDMNKSFKSNYDSAKLFTAQLGLAISGVQQIYSVLDRSLGSFIRAAQEQESAFITLQAALRATGMEVDVNAAKLSNFASEIQKATIYGDELLMTSMAQMQNIARFSNVDTLKGATKAAIGLSAAFGIDLATAMDLIAKAAAGNTSMLGRYGIVLDETASQAEKFNQVVSIGSGYFSIAEEQAASSIGAITQLKNTWGDLQEILAEGIVPLLSDLANALKPVIEAAGAMGAEQRNITMGLIIMNALVVKHTLAIMAQKTAFAALSIEQQHQVASLMILIGMQKGATITTITFSGVMKALGASMMAAGRAVQGFLASIGPVGWIIIGITGAYAALNAVFKVNTKLMKEQMDVERQRLEQEKDRVSGLQNEAKETLKLAERYQKLAEQSNKSAKEQKELSTIHNKLSSRYPHLINSTDGFSQSLNGVKEAAKDAKKAIAELSGEQWKLDLQLIKNQVESTRINVYDAMVKNFNWRDIWLSPERGIALESVKNDMNTLLNNDSSVLTDAYLSNLSKRWDDFGKQRDKFNKKEQIELQRGALMVKTMISYRQRYNALLSEGPKSGDEDGGSSHQPGDGNNEVDMIMREIADYRILRRANFDEEQGEIALLRRDYAEKLKIVAGNASAEGDLQEKRDMEISKIQAKYQEQREKDEAAHYEKLKFYAEGYYDWKLKQIESEAEKAGASEAWKREQIEQLDKERSEWDNRAIKAFEEKYSAEMSHLAELRELGLATHSEVAEKAWEYYDTLMAIVEADGVVTEEEKKLLEMYRKRGQAAQLAVNRDSDVAAYYDEIRFLDSSYYAWKKARIEEDVRLMDISEEQKVALIKAKLDALKLEMQDFYPDKSLFNHFLDSLDIPTEHQAKIKSSFQFLANQISSIWSQLYSNLASNRDQSLADLEHRAKKERKTDAWLAKEKDRINEEYEKKHRSLKRTEQKMQIASATANTLEGITNALTVKPAWLAPIMAASVGALGFAQVKLIAEQKFATGGHFRGRGSSTSDSNIIAVSDNEYIVSADRVNRFGVPFFDALNFGNGEQIRKALSSIRIPAPSISYPAKSHGYASGGVVRPQAPISQNLAMNVVLKCDGKALAKAVIKGKKRIIST